MGIKGLLKKASGAVKSLWDDNQAGYAEIERARNSQQNSQPINCEDKTVSRPDVTPKRKNENSADRRIATDRITYLMERLNADMRILGSSYCPYSKEKLLELIFYHAKELKQYEEQGLYKSYQNTVYFYGFLKSHGFTNVDIETALEEQKRVKAKNKEALRILEEKCLRLISEYDFQGAYKAVCQYEIDSPYQRGIGVKWENELVKGLSENTENYYTNMMDNETTFSLPERLLPFRKDIAVCSVYGHMMGFGFKKTAGIIKKRLPVYIDGKMIFQTTSNVGLEAIRGQSTAHYETLHKEGIVNQYKVLASLDLKTCIKCGSMDQKVFNWSDKIVGINYPPFHDGCRCCVTPYFPPDEVDALFEKSKRVARDPMTDKVYYIDADMAYPQWMQELRNQYGGAIDKKRLEAEQNILQEQKDREDYTLLRDRLPEFAPKSFSGYRRMRSARSESYLKLVEAASAIGINLDK